MAGRRFDGIDDNIITSAAALEQMSYGTVAYIFKRRGTGYRTALAFDTSSNNTQWATGWNDSNALYMWTNDGSNGPSVASTTTHYLVVVRKGDGVLTPRFSLYDFVAATWTHAAGSLAIGNGPVAGVSGVTGFDWGGAELADADFYVRAAWANEVQWSADAAGDAAIEAAGLHTSYSNWVTATSGTNTALWRFDQASTTDPVNDQTGNGANQTSIVGTTVVTGDDPPGFSWGGGTTHSAAGAVTATATITASAETTTKSAQASVAATATVTATATATKSASATLTATAAVSASSGRYVEGVSANGRYFVDGSGNPILIRGESPWSMMVDLSSSEMDTYLGNRAGYGCNLMLTGIVGSTGLGGPNNNGATYDGVLPFVGGDPTNFNATYWARMDSYIAKAKAQGITLLIYAMDGWNTLPGCVFAPGTVTTTQCQTYGQTLATRYASEPHIMWAFGGDYDGLNSEINGLFNACLTGIRAAGDTRPATIQLIYETSESHNVAFWESKVDWDYVYTYYVTYKGMKDGYDHVWSTSPTTKPALFSEGAYENSGGGHPGTDLVIRRQAAWALTSGSGGDITGQEGVWQFNTGWQSLLDTTAAAQLQAIRDAFEGVAWWKLVPDDASQLVTAGRGTRITDDTAVFPTDNTYVTAARAADSSLAVIYMPNAASAITVDMTKIGSSPTATWVDPTNGATVSTTPGSSYSRGNNAAGSTDWLLILTGGVTQEGQAAVTATATITAAATVTRSGAATVAGAAGITAAATPARSAAATTTAIATVTATAGVVKSAAASLTVTATITAAGAIPSSIVGFTIGDDITIGQVTNPTPGDMAQSYSVTGPELRRIVTGPETAAADYDGPTAVTNPTPDELGLARTVTGPALARTVTGPEE